MAARGFAVAAGPYDVEDAHVHGDQAAVDFEAAESQVHVSLATKNGKATGWLNGADGAVNTRTSGYQQSVTDEDRLGNHGDKGIAVAGSRRTHVANDVQTHLRSGSNFSRLGARLAIGGGCGGEKQCASQDCGQQSFHEFPPAHTMCVG